MEKFTFWGGPLLALSFPDDQASIRTRVGDVNVTGAGRKPR